jgi:hypothetical protein
MDNGLGRNLKDRSFYVAEASPSIMVQLLMVAPENGRRRAVLEIAITIP